MLRQLATQQSTIRILDVCYGLGYNSAAALEAIWSIDPQCRVELMALEIDPDVPRHAVEYKLLQPWQSPIPDILAELSSKHTVEREYVTAKLILQDARLAVKSPIEMSHSSWQADVIFLDPFSPRKCPPTLDSRVY